MFHPIRGSEMHKFQNSHKISIIYLCGKDEIFTNLWWESILKMIWLQYGFCSCSWFYVLFIFKIKVSQTQTAVGARKEKKNLLTFVFVMAAFSHEKSVWKFLESGEENSQDSRPELVLCKHEVFWPFSNPSYHRHIQYTQWQTWLAYTKPETWKPKGP